VGLRDRLRRAEKRAGLDRKPRCQVCGGRIVIEVVAPDGTVSYPGGPPCEVCGSTSTAPGEVSWLVYESSYRTGAKKRASMVEAAGEGVAG
jgi:hypothetical protein